MSIYEYIKKKQHSALKHRLKLCYQDYVIVRINHSPSQFQITQLPFLQNQFVPAPPKCKIGNQILVLIRFVGFSTRFSFQHPGPGSCNSPKLPLCPGPLHCALTPVAVECAFVNLPSRKRIMFLLGRIRPLQPVPGCNQTFLPWALHTFRWL